MRRTLILLALILACEAQVVEAQAIESKLGTQAPPLPPPTTIIIRPAGEPVPALKYRLVPERRSQVPGNAAIFYHRGILLFQQKQVALASVAKDPAAESAGSVEMKISKWNALPITEIPRDEAIKQVAQFENVLKESELAASRTFCDWEFDSRTEGYSLMLPEIQAMRSLARIVQLKAKLAILDGKTDEAFHWIQVGMVMGRYVSEGPTIIQGLVGVAINTLMAKTMEELIQAPGTPSLYWALADRPHPFIDARHAMEAEHYLLEKEFPELRELDQGVWSVDQAQRFANELQHKLFALIGGEMISGTNTAVPTNMPDMMKRMGIAAMSAKIYPVARKALIAQGKSEAVVESMPIVQVAALYTFQEYQKGSDSIFKWMNLPYWQSVGKIDAEFNATIQDKMANPLLSLFKTLTPALQAARLAFVRIDRHLDALQCIEAIRIYAAAHGGKLPASLDAITEAPTPIDPATGKPFHYTVDGDSASLTAPVPWGGPNHPSYMIRYELKLAR